MDKATSNSSSRVVKHGVEHVEHIIEIEVPFHDVDSMGIVWHGHYIKYLELARCALLDKIGFGYREMASSPYSWPVIEVKTKYVSPAKFGQMLTVRAALKEWDLRLKIAYLIQDKDTGRRITRAHTAQVAVEQNSGEMVIPLPTEVQKVFQDYVDSGES